MNLIEADFAPNSKTSETIEENLDKGKNYSKITRTTGEEEEDNQDYMELLGVFESDDYF